MRRRRERGRERGGEGRENVGRRWGGREEGRREGEGGGGMEILLTAFLGIVERFRVFRL